MSRTDLDATTLANSLRMKAGDGSIEWIHEPMQASVLLDIADMLDERDELYAELGSAQINCDMWHDRAEDMRNRLSAKQAENAKLRKLLQDYHRYEHEDCYACRYINECRADESGRCIAPVRLGERYRELGVEVD